MKYQIIKSAFSTLLFLKKGEKTLKKIIIVLFLLSFFSAMHTVAYAEDTALVVNDDSTGFEWGTNGKSTCKSQSYYLTFFNKANGNYYIYTTDGPLENMGTYLYATVGTTNLYKLNTTNNTYELVSSTTDTYRQLTSNLESFQFFYGNYTIMVQVNYENVPFFLQTPLTKAKTITTIKGAITANQIITTILCGIRSLILLLMGLIISVVAFWKAWGMLRTSLSKL